MCIAPSIVPSDGPGAYGSPVPCLYRPLSGFSLPTTSAEDAPDARWILESRVAYFSRRIVPMPVYLPRDPP